MLNSKSTRTLVLALLAIGSALAFQNCSPVAFKAFDNSGAKVSQFVPPTDPILPVDPPADVSPNTVPADVSGPPVTPAPAPTVDTEIDGVRQNCTQLTNEPIAYDNLPAGPKDFHSVSLIGGSSFSNNEYISGVSLIAGFSSVKAREIDSISITGGTSYNNASQVGSASIIGGLLTIIADKINNVSSTAGTVCVSTDNIAQGLSGIGGNFVAQARTANAQIPSISTIIGGAHSFKGYKIDRISGITGGTIVLENCQINSIEGITGGEIILKNSSVNLITNAVGGAVVLKNSVVNSVENSIAFTVVP